MPGFLPAGYVEAAILREIVGVDRLGSWLATGAIVAYVEDDDGDYQAADPRGWRKHGRAREFLEHGALISDEGEHFPLVFKSHMPAVSLPKLVDLYRREKAGVLPPAAAKIVKNKGGRNPVYDWGAAMIELARVELDTGFVTKHSDSKVAGHLMEWFGTHGDGRVPADTITREKVAAFRAAMPVT